MTSKNSSFKLFVKLMKQDIIRRIWLPIIILISFFLAYDIRLLMIMEDMAQNPKDYSYGPEYYICNRFLGVHISYGFVLAAVIAVVCAVSGFMYLYSKSQLDTYHSMPVSRNILFGSRLLSGFLMFFVPLVLVMLSVMGIAAANGGISSGILGNMACYIGYVTLIFGAVYAVSVIAVCLTGNFVVGIMAVVVLVCYSPVVYFGYNSLLEMFFYSYYSHNADNSVWKFSPLGIIINYISRTEEGMEYSGAVFSYGAMGSDLAYVIVYIIIAVLIGMLLYAKRPSEAAGNAISFRLSQPVIKFFIVIPLSLFCAMFFMAMSYSGKRFGWFIFGAVFGFLIFSAVMEIIYNLDIKCAFKNRRQLLINGAALALIILVLKQDVLGYNTYIPSEKEVESYSVSINGLFQDSLVDKYYTTERGYVYYDYINADDYRMEHVRIADGEAVRYVVDKAVRDYPKKDGVWYRSLIVGYNLKNGRQVYRRYYVNLRDEEMYKCVETIFNNPDYKNGSFPILSTQWDKEYNALKYSDMMTDGFIMLDEKKRQEITDIYASELLKLTFEDAVTTVPIGKISFYMGSEKYDIYNSENGNDYYIYPQFTKTIAWIEENGGIQVFDGLTKEILESISSVDISRRYYESDETVEAEAVEIMRYSSVEYDDSEKIKEILDSAVWDEMVWVASYLEERGEDEYHIDIKFENGEIRYADFLNGKIPEFVKEDIAEQAKNTNNR